VPHAGCQHTQGFQGRELLAHESFEAGLQIGVKNYRYERTGCGPTLAAMRVHLIVLGFVFGATAAAAGDSQRNTPAAADAAQRDGQHDFDFIFGRWKIHMKRRSRAARGADTWTEFDGYSVYHSIWDGRANLNEFEADGPSGHIEGLTLRTYNPHTHQWSLHWASSRNGILAPPQVGQFRDGRGEFYAQDVLGGRSVFVRYVWSKMTADSARFEQAFSSDGGRSWDVNWISDMRRMADTSGGGSGAGDAHGAAADPEAIQGSAHDGQRDFEPLLGSWKYHLQRRLNPLTGSSQWVDLVGTGVCYPLWGGRAELDTFLAHGTSGRIEGLTLRLYDPKTRQWRLYWANSKDGVVAVPQIGAFKDGHGEFYAQDTLNEKSILVRFDWTALTTSSPHFEQSFSADGGKTWEVNWITDQTRVSP